ncbi:carbohydrate ABC transporter permease [Oceanibium sediminis]|uniref:carbohydrate ABC transporter permease n=1 Tax=Oceanibium sediminis TaxID=2026339 RepID=UPI0018E571A2|nr:sugar ABC transporter permease [Oceanibium sediminis]
MLYPLAFSGWLAFHEYRLTRLDDVHFVGFENFVLIATDPSFLNAMGNTLIFVLGAVSLELVIGLSLALLLQKLNILRNFSRSILLAPMFVTPIAVGLMFRFLLNAELGVIPHYLSKIGITVDWFGPDLALFSLILIDVWQWTPFMLLMFLAGLEALPKTPYEAARVDGAGPWLTFSRITLPMLRSVIVVALIIRALDAFKVFEYVFAITRGGPGNSTETIMYYIYQTGFRFFRMGEAAAAAIMLITVILVLVVLLVKFSQAEEARK